MNFQQKLDTIIEKNNSLVCVGLDSDINKMPDSFKQRENAQFEFNKAIIDATHDYVCCYKPNSAFYEAYGIKGIKELKQTCDYIRGIYPEIPIIIDAKRGDIGNTNNGYAKFVFDYLMADAITVIPYFGIEALASYFAYDTKGIIIGCHSSNPGAKEFQEKLVLESSDVIPDLSSASSDPLDPESIEGIRDPKKAKPLYHIVAQEIMKQYGNNPNTMIFMGATYPEELGTIRTIIKDMTILAPGVGAQEGAVEKAVKAGLNSKKSGLLINSSRGIIFASNGDDFAEKAREATEQLRNEINKYRII